MTSTGDMLQIHIVQIDIVQIKIVQINTVQIDPGCHFPGSLDCLGSVFLNSTCTVIESRYGDSGGVK